MGEVMVTPEAKIVYARAQHVLCPHCEEEVDGWYGDPRGKETECDHCEKKFKVAEDAEVKLS